MENQQTAVYNFYPVRAAAILTTGVVPGTVLGGNSPANFGWNNDLIIYADFTIGSLTNVILTLEFSKDGTNWYAETYEDIAASTGVATSRVKTHVISANGKYRLPPIIINDKYVRISAQGTGTVAGSSLTIGAVVGRI